MIRVTLREDVEGLTRLYPNALLFRLTLASLSSQPDAHGPWLSGRASIRSMLALFYRSDLLMKSGTAREMPAIAIH